MFPGACALSREDFFVRTCACDLLIIYNKKISLIQNTNIASVSCVVWFLDASRRTTQQDGQVILAVMHHR